MVLLIPGPGVKVLDLLIIFTAHTGDWCFSPPPTVCYDDQLGMYDKGLNRLISNSILRTLAKTLKNLVWTFRQPTVAFISEYLALTGTHV